MCPELCTPNFYDLRTLIRFLLTAGLGAGFAVHAADVDWDDWKGTVNTTFTMGTQVRTKSPDPALVYKSNGATQGIAGYALSGQNDDDSNLNYKSGDAISSVIKGYSELRLKRRDTELVLAARAWYDYGLIHDARPWGNLPNNYSIGAPLSDSGLDPLAKFSGIALGNAYLGQHWDDAGTSVDLRFGNQSLQQWGERASIGGGLSAISPVDANAARRAGALPAEAAIPVPQITARWQFAPQNSIEVFYQVAFIRSELPGCGTFFSSADYVAEGCGGVFPGGASTDGAKYAAGSYVKRAETIKPNDQGQFGIAYRTRFDSLNTGFGVYLSQYDNRTPNIDVLKSTRATPFIPGDADGKNVQYRTEYADNVQVLGLTADSKWGATNLSAEFTYRPNQPVGLNGSDLLNAFLSNAAATPLRQDASNTSPGANYQGFDRLHMIQLQIAAQRAFKETLGADTFTLAGEIGARNYSDLPDVTVRRYGRSTIFGLGPVNGVCAAGSSSAACSNDGYVSNTSWGYRVRASARYPGLLSGWDFIPTVSYAHDVSGWSHDNVFNQGRQLLNLSLRGEFQKKYFADFGYSTVINQADYDPSRDREYLSLAIGVSF